MCWIAASQSEFTPTTNLQSKSVSAVTTRADVTDSVVVWLLCYLNSQLVIAVTVAVQLAVKNSD